METDNAPSYELSNVPSGTPMEDPPSYSSVVNKGYQNDEEGGCNGEKKDSGGPIDTLQKTLGFRQGFSLMIGNILGSGIFISPSIIASNTTSAGMMIVVWIVGGLLGMMGSLCYCELGGIFKVAGGNYVNILKIYGTLPAFLCAWTTCLVIDTSTLSAISLTIGSYLSKPFYKSEEDAEVTAKIIAICVIILALILTSLSSKFVGRLQRVFAVIQISSVVFLVCIGFYQLSKKSYSNFKNMFKGTSFNSREMVHLGLATFGALWSYDGWSRVMNVIEEMKNLKRNLLLMVITSFPVVIVCYLLANLSLLTLLSREDMANSKAVAVDFVTTSVNKKAAYVMMTLVGLAAYGTLSGAIFAVPRLTLAAAREGHMPKFFTYIHATTGAPVPAAILTALVSSIMLIPKSSNLDKLILMFSQAQWLIYGANILGVLVLRWRQPHVERPYRVFFAFPVVMTIVAFALVITPFFKSPMLSLGLFLFIFLGIPVYLAFVYYRQKLPMGIALVVDQICDFLQTRCNMVPCLKNDSK